VTSSAIRIGSPDTDGLAASKACAYTAFSRWKIRNPGSEYAAFEPTGRITRRSFEPSAPATIARLDESPDHAVYRKPRPSGRNRGQ
jgi:hypothetical protein